MRGERLPILLYPQIQRLLRARLDVYSRLLCWWDALGSGYGYRGVGVVWGYQAHPCAGGIHDGVSADASEPLHVPLIAAHVRRVVSVPIRAREDPLPRRGVNVIAALADTHVRYVRPRYSPWCLISLADSEGAVGASRHGPQPAAIAALFFRGVFC